MESGPPGSLRRPRASPENSSFPSCTRSRSLIDIADREFAASQRLVTRNRRVCCGSLCSARWRPTSQFRRTPTCLSPSTPLLLPASNQLFSYLVPPDPKNSAHLWSKTQLQKWKLSERLGRCTCRVIIAQGVYQAASVTQSFDQTEAIIKRQIATKRVAKTRMTKTPITSHVVSRSNLLTTSCALVKTRGCSRPCDAEVCSALTRPLDDGIAEFNL
jgi:hypothetical protein